MTEKETGDEEKNFITSKDVSLCCFLRKYRSISRESDLIYLLIYKVFSGVVR